VVEILIYIVVVAIIAGLLAWLVNSAPFIEGQFKQLAVWAILALAVLVIVLKLAGVAGVDL
jgi:hypothetical protein